MFGSLDLYIKLITAKRVFPVGGCAVDTAVTAIGGFISGVLLTAAIAGVVALVVLCRAKRRGTTKLELVLSLHIYSS